MKTITSMDAAQLYDHSSLPIDAEGHFALGRGVRVYCSWAYLPSENATVQSVHYIPTCGQNESDYVDYLNVMYNISEELVFAFTLAQRLGHGHPNNDMGFDNFDMVLDMQIKRRTQTMQRSRSNSSVRRSSGRPRSASRDPRFDRAMRMKRMPILRAKFAASVPRLVILSDLECFELRRDYLFTRHSRYVNVFRVTIDPDWSDGASDTDLSNGDPW